MNFNIIENPRDDYNLDEIIQDYTNLELPVTKIREKYGLSQGKWERILKEMREKDVPIRDKHYNRYLKLGKYYYYNKKLGLYHIIRVFKGKHYSFGYFKTEKEAQERVEELHENGWDGLLL